MTTSTSDPGGAAYMTSANGFLSLRCGVAVV
jgi:hypothetical protein